MKRVRWWIGINRRPEKIVTAGDVDGDIRKSILGAFREDYRFSRDDRDLIHKPTEVIGCLSDTNRQMLAGLMSATRFHNKESVQGAHKHNE